MKKGGTVTTHYSLGGSGTLETVGWAGNVWKGGARVQIPVWERKRATRRKKRTSAKKKI